MRLPTINNKYNLTPKDVERIVLLDSDIIKKQSNAYYNPTIKAWYVVDNTAKSVRDYDFNTYLEGCLKIYDDINKKPTLDFYRRGAYKLKFNNFFDLDEIKTESQLEIQERIMALINELLDQKIIGLM